MKARTTLATLFVAAALEAASAGVGGRAKADAWAAVDTLSDFPDVQEQALRNVLLASVEKATRDILARLQQVFDDDEDADLAAAFSAGSAPSKRSMGESDTSINAEAIRRILREGIPSMGIPPLDPFRISYVPLNLTIPEVIELQANIEDLSFNGLSSFQENIEHHELLVGQSALNMNVSANVLIHRLQLLTQYKADANFDFGLDVWGDGLIDLVLNHLKVNVNMAIKASQWLTEPVVSPCEIGIKSRGIQMEIEGLFGGGLLSQLVGEIITDMVNEVLGDVVNLVENIVQGGMCEWLSSKSTTELIGLFTRFVSMPLPNTPT